ncbi:choice-of-anchor R domain-containing protein [Tunturiibacter lichenicola]|uniref:choice-of-anchor R domain-containing protein n=1 Tax=Tunturiibacter lichenicola TaxID=2051959 RepID=UPI0021B330EA|nr:choice-of-anchor R domain-containing protein [Edaphobacter lichenicola]
MRSNTVGTLSILALVVVLLTSTSASHADTLFTNFGPNHSFENLYGGWVIGQCCDSGDEVLAFPFMPDETATLTNALLALQSEQGASPINLYLEASDAAGAPGAILDQFTQNGSILPTASVVNFTCASCPVLDEGTLYFLVAQEANPPDWGDWGYTLDSIDTYGFGYGISYFDSNGSPEGPWTQTLDAFPAYEVDGIATTPEPPTIVLFTFGAIGLVAIGCRRLA